MAPRAHPPAGTARGFGLSGGERGGRGQEDYTVPRFFRDDAYEVSREARHTFPNHTFFIAGAARSGTPLHVDPNQTGAWNSLLCGRKRWVLFPPGIAAEAAEAAGLSQEHYKSKTIPPTRWWREHYPRLTAPDEARRVGMVRPRPARRSPSAATRRVRLVRVRDAACPISTG
jgi:hypothetical protein